jgi:hypothetical protein
MQRAAKLCDLCDASLAVMVDGIIGQPPQIADYAIGKSVEFEMRKVRGVG